MMSQTRNSSYKKLFLLWESSEDMFEKEVLGRILTDYLKNHRNEFSAYDKLLHEFRKPECPECHSNNFIKYGKNRNGTLRYLCKECGKTFNCASDTLFFSSKVNIVVWFSFLECLLNGTSVRSACITAKISTVTGTAWMKKIFYTLRNYQESIVLNETIWIDETYVHEDSSKIYLLEEIGKIKKVRKQPRGISRNKICILIATDKANSFAEIVCHGRPQRIPNYNICRKHLKTGSHLIGDEDSSLTYAANKMNLTRTMYKSNTEEAYRNLEPVDQLCARLKFFIDKHRGFKKELLQDYLNLFILIDNEKKTDGDLYKVTIKLLKLMCEQAKSGLDIN